MLAFNGQVFGGMEVNGYKGDPLTIQISIHENDTLALSNAFESTKSEDDLLRLISNIKGEYAFVYFKVVYHLIQNST